MRSSGGSGRGPTIFDDNTYSSTQQDWANTSCVSEGIVYPHAISRSEEIPTNQSTLFGAPAGKSGLRLFYNEPTWANSIKYTLLYANWPFELNSVATENWGDLNASGAILEVGGYQLRQATGILRYCGKLTKMYPDDPYHAMICDEIIYHIRDYKRNMSFTIHKSTILNNLISALESRISQARGRFAVGERVTVADMEILSLLQWVYDGKILGCPANAFEGSREIMRVKNNVQDTQEYKNLPKDTFRD